MSIDLSGPIGHLCGTRGREGRGGEGWRGGKGAGGIGRTRIFGRDVCGSAAVKRTMRADERTSRARRVREVEVLGSDLQHRIIITSPASVRMGVGVDHELTVS